MRSNCPFYVISEFDDLISLHHKLLSESENCYDLLVMLDDLSRELSLFVDF